MPLVNPDTGSAPSATQYIKRQAGDLTGSTMILRLRYKSSAGVNQIIDAATGYPFVWWARNLSR